MKKYLFIGLIAILLGSCAKETAPSIDQSVCKYVQWTGTGNCANVGYNPVSNTTCCPDGSPFYYTGGFCYTTCDAATQKAGGATIYRYNDGNISSGTGGYNCVGGTCTAVSSNATYSTLSACQVSCASAPSCTSMNSYVTIVSAAYNNMCGNTNDLKVIFKNNSSQRLAIQIAIQKMDGTWNCGLATTLSGVTDYYYTCNSSGHYVIRAYTYNDWMNGCNFTTCP